MTTSTITTARLVLAPLSIDETDLVHAYRAHPEVTRYQGFDPRDRAHVAEWVAAGAANPLATPGVWTQLGIRTRDEARLIGDLGVHALGDDPTQVEIGFTLAPDAQGQGFATEAVSALLDHLFDTLGKERVRAHVDPRNAPSIRLLERLEARLVEKGELWTFAWTVEEWHARRR